MGIKFKFSCDNEPKVVWNTVVKDECFVSAIATLNIQAADAGSIKDCVIVHLNRGYHSAEITLSCGRIDNIINCFALQNIRCYEEGCTE